VNKIKEKIYAKSDISEILFKYNNFFIKKFIGIKKHAKIKYKTKHFFKQNLLKKYWDKPIKKKKMQDDKTIKSNEKKKSLTISTFKTRHPCH
jgi:hypothetical protein